MRISHTHVLQFHADLEEVFPLFTPVKEKYWAAHWDIHIIFSQTPTAEEQGCVFSTQHGNLPETLWVMSCYEPPYRIQYVRFAPKHHIATIDIVVAEGVQVQVTYTVTGLSEAGHQYIKTEFSEDAYRHQMLHWQQAIDHYLKTGNHSS